MKPGKYLLLLYFDNENSSEPQQNVCISEQQSALLLNEFAFLNELSESLIQRHKDRFLLCS